MISVYFSLFLPFLRSLFTFECLSFPSFFMKSNVLSSEKNIYINVMVKNSNGENQW